MIETILYCSNELGTYTFSILKGRVRHEPIQNKARRIVELFFQM